MNKIKCLLYVELYKIRKNKTFFITVIIAVLYGILATLIIGKKISSFYQISSFLTNSSIILLITPIVMDYANECSVGFFQDAVSIGINRSIIFFIKESFLFIQAMFVYFFLYLSIYLTSAFKHIPCELDMIILFRLFLYLSCLFFTGFLIAVIVERIIPFTVICASLSIILSIIGTILIRISVSKYYIYGLNHMIFQKNISISDNKRYIFSAIITFLIIDIIAYLKFNKTEFKSDIQDI